jgi:NAD(P)-dependent dehydrogenase (short-subunit alcohol dehydrogenase family)
MAAKWSLRTRTLWVLPKLRWKVRYATSRRARAEGYSRPCNFTWLVGDAAASGIPEFDALLDKAKAKAPAQSLVNTIEDVGVATAFLAHDAARLITGETFYVDGGYHIID